MSFVMIIRQSVYEIVHNSRDKAILISCNESDFQPESTHNQSIMQPQATRVENIVGWFKIRIRV